MRKVLLCRYAGRYICLYMVNYPEECRITTNNVLDDRLASYITIKCISSVYSILY